MNKPDNQAKPLHPAIHHGADASRPVVPYLWRKPRTSRRSTKHQTEAQKRASAINFALFRLKSAHATTCNVPWLLKYAPKDGLTFEQQAELHKAREYIDVAEMYLKDAIYALQSYNDMTKALVEKKATEALAAKRANKQGEL